LVAARLLEFVTKLENQLLAVAKSSKIPFLMVHNLRLLTNQEHQALAGQPYQGFSAHQILTMLIRIKLG
jgi:hypothetical protein